MSIAKKIAIGAVVVVGAVVVAGAMLPKDYSVERSIDIAATPEKVFAEVNELRRWNAWSPWIAKDPSISNRYSGSESGVGAKVSWTSEDSGSGTQEITQSQSPSFIETKLDFGEMGTSTSTWHFEAKGEGTHVRWGMSGSNPGVIGGLFNVMMDKWVGADYEDGLARLKKQVEQAR